MLDLADKKIIVCTHYHTYGPAQALRDYLVSQKIESLFYISHQLQLGEEASSFYEKIKSGQIINKKEVSRQEKSFSWKCFRDLFLTLFWTIKSGEKYDLFVGSDNLNALAGLILKWLGFVKKVVYYTIDYYPTRFENKFLNNLYYKLDKFCVKYSDEIWNVSEKMIEARAKKYGNKFVYNDKQKTVPIGVWFDRVKRKNILEINKQQVVFVGHLKADMGVDLVVRSISRIIEKIPNFEFLLIGGGEEFENLKKLVSELKVESHVTMTNWVKDRLQLEDLMLKSAIGLAPFNVNIVDEKFYNADPAKIKDYMLMGMPVILTPVPASTQQLKEAGCVVVIDYNEESLANAIIDLLLNEDKLKNYREKAVEYIKNFDWQAIFSYNLSRILNN